MKTKKLAALLLLVMGCGPITIVLPPGQLPPPDCNGDVTVALSSVTLAQDCPDAKAAADGLWQGACAENVPCPTLCRQTSMQLSFNSTRPVAANVKIVSVRLLDVNSRQELDKLTSRAPSQWKASEYVPWDEKVLAQSALKASYKLSAPQYHTYATDSNRFAYQGTFLVEVVVDIEGEVHTLTIEAQREPEVAT
jgi:hypothetical protein